MIPIKIAINTNYKGKLPSDAPVSMWREFNGTFVNTTLPLPILAAHIRKGHSYTTQHNGYRKKGNFLCAQHIALDFDTCDERSSIPYLRQNEFISNYASLIHTTASHTNDCPRARVIFVLDTIVKNKSHYVTIAQALVHKFQSSDQACKDPVRLFYGAKDCVTLILNQTLPITVVAEELVKPYLEYLDNERRLQRKILQGKEIICAHDVDNMILDVILRNELQKIAVAPDGEKYNTLIRVSRTLGGYVGGGYFDKEFIIAEVSNAILSRRLKNKTHALRAVRKFVRYGMQEPLYVMTNLEKEITWSDLGLETFDETT